MTANAVIPEWRENISRGTALALMSNFTSVAEALRELVDNPIDYRDGQNLLVTIDDDRKRDCLIVESDGGRGMGAREIQVWLNWGEGEDHQDTHIGQWHQGGKAACGFLGSHVRLWAKRRGADDVWYFEDKDWGTRAQARTFGVPTPLPSSQYPESMRRVPTDRGHVRVEISRLNRSRRWNLEQLKKDLSNTYRCLLQEGKLRIRMGTDELRPLTIPTVPTSREVHLDVALPGGLRAKGWATRMARGQQVTTHLRSGLRLLYNGRLVKEGEWFGYNYEGKGALNSLIGELTLSRFKPNLNKTDFTERGDTIWEELGKGVKSQLAPLIAELREAGSEERITKEEKEQIRQVADELAEVFKGLKGTADAIDWTGPAHEGGLRPGQGGRRPPTPSEQKSPSIGPESRTRLPPQPRTEPPLDAVGELVRLVAARTEDDGKVPLRLKSWDPSQRSTWSTDGGKRWLDINKSYYLYRALNGNTGYLAETAVLELCKPREGEVMTAQDYVAHVDLVLLHWGELTSKYQP